MVKLNEKYVTDKAGRATQVILSRREYLGLLSYLEDLEDRLEIKRRKKSSQFTPWEQLKAELKHTGRL